MRHGLILAVLLALPAPVLAQNFTTAAEVRPILEVTRGNWLAIGTHMGSDMLYFTHLLAWRCGLDEIRYGINGAEAETLYEMEPCHSGTAQPNAIQGLPYVALPLDTIESVRVTITYDDGKSATAEFTRAEILLP